MPSEQPLLTIAIPTYNRSRYLAQLLESLVPQLKDEPRVELIISDNASQDDTPNLVRRFLRDGLQARYIRNPENIGPDRNFLQCFEDAQGSYVWLIGDDDVVLEGGVEAVLSCCGEGPAIIYLASRWFNGDYSPGAFHFISKARRRTYSENAAFAKTMNVWVTFLSGTVVSKEAFLKAREIDLQVFLETNLVQLGWVLPLLVHGKKFIHIKTPIVACKSENTGGYHLVQIFGEKFRAVGELLLREKPELEKILENAVIMRLLPPFLLKMRSGDPAFASAGNKELLHRLYKTNIRFSLFLYPILAWNLCWVRLVCLGIRVVNRMDKALGSPLL